MTVGRRSSRLGTGWRHTYPGKGKNTREYHIVPMEMETRLSVERTEIQTSGVEIELCAFIQNYAHDYLLYYYITLCAR